MHGLGADGHDFASLPLQLGVSPDLAVRYVFPHAPVIPVTLNMGMRMRAWYDIVSLGARGQDETGIRRSAASIEDLIAREVDRGVPSSRIVLAGFSQGAAMALFTGLRHAAPLAGILALSGYLPLHESLPAEASAASQQVEILQALLDRQRDVAQHLLCTHIEQSRQSVHKISLSMLEAARRTYRAG